MNRAMCRIVKEPGYRLRVGVFTLMAACVLPAQTLPENSTSAGHGSLELVSGLGRKLYALPDNDALSDARRSLAASPKSADLVIRLSKAQAARRQYKEAVATSTMGLTFAPENADLYVERGHRELGLREFRPAMKDLEHAVRLAPENLPSGRSAATIWTRGRC